MPPESPVIGDGKYNLSPEIRLLLALGEALPEGKDKDLLAALNEWKEDALKAHARREDLLALEAQLKKGRYYI